MKSSKPNSDTIGIEWELLFVDERSFDLVDYIHPLMNEMGDAPGISTEAFQSSVEIKTSPVNSIAEAHDELLEKLEMLSHYCKNHGIKLCSFGAHPFHSAPGKTTLEKRYLDFEKEYPYITKHHLTCSTQIHVSMDGTDEMIKVMNRMRNYLPVFTALSSSSPYFLGEPTGHVSIRQHFIRSAQNSGTPPLFVSWEEFEKYFIAANEAGFIQSYKDIHWDIRPRPDLGTIEFRVMDAMPSLSENLALCALAHALIKKLKLDPLPLKLLADVPEWAEKENEFMASHLGLEARIIVNEKETRSLKDVAMDLCETLKEAEYLEITKAMIKEGPPYVRMIREYQNTSSMARLVEKTSSELFN